MSYQISNIFFYTFAVLSSGQKSIFRIEEIIKKEGYVVETYDMTTSDNYLLTLHRIPHKRNATSSGDNDRVVVFLMHGLLTASNSFILLGPEYSLGYILADGGFDVWMGNARGNKNSRFHDYWDPDHPEEKKEFFNYSWEEIGLHDVAEMIDFVLAHTHKQKLHYIAHGAGGTSFLVLNSMKPEYNVKFLSVHLMASMGYQRYFDNKELKSVSNSAGDLYATYNKIGHVEMFPPGSADLARARHEVPLYCFGGGVAAHFCKALGIQEVMDGSFLRAHEDFETGGASSKEIVHYIQNIRDSSFRRFDYGTEENLKLYGTIQPPAYNLSLITANVTFHYSEGDRLVNEKDVLDMAHDMPLATTRKVARLDFQHHDFVTSKDAKSLVYNFIVEGLLNNSVVLNGSVLVSS